MRLVGVILENLEFLPWCHTLPGFKDIYTDDTIICDTPKINYVTV